MAREVALQRDPHAHAQYWCNYSYSHEKLRTVELINVVMQLQRFIMYNMIIFNYTICKKKVLLALVHAIINKIYSMYISFHKHGTAKIEEFMIYILDHIIIWNDCTMIKCFNS